MTNSYSAMPGMSPRFIKRLPELIGTLLEVTNIIREPVERAELAIAEIQDFTDFEIAKLELAAKLNGLPPEGLERLKDLQSFKDKFPATALQQVTHAISDLCDTMWPYIPDPLADSYDPTKDL